MDSRIATYEHIQTVQNILGNVILDLQKRLLKHDQSKLFSPEVEVFDKYTSKLASSTYGSEEYKSFLREMKPALDHHYANNSHHPEHYGFLVCEQCGIHKDEGCSCGGGFILISDVSAMNLLDIIEMLCDWKASTLRCKDGDIRKSIEMNQKRFGYSNELKQILLNTLLVIENGN